MSLILMPEGKALRNAMVTVLENELTVEKREEGRSGGEEETKGTGR